MRKATPGRAPARALPGLPAVEDPAHVRKLHAREPGDLRVARGWRLGPHREGRRPSSGDERHGEVGRARSTCEVAEQGRATGGGGDGGKGLAQGERGPGRRTPDTEPEPRCVLRTGSRTTGCRTGQAGEVHGPSGPSSSGSPSGPEGGAQCVSSARWDLCGGHRAIGVPTATRFIGYAKSLQPPAPAPRLPAAL